MILRRITQHVKDQNWTAIGIDFLIVVLGVVIGIQVSNWNAARLERQQEAALLANMRDDLHDDAGAMQGRIVALGQAAAYGQDVLDRLSSDEPCTDDCWTTIVHAFHASQWLDLSVDRTTFDEMRRLGMPSDDALRDALDTYVLRSERLDLANEVPRYRELARSIIPVLAQQHLWDQCYRIDGDAEVMLDDCPSVLTPAESRAVIEEFRRHPETVGSLTYRVSTISLLIKALRIQIEESEAVMDLIAAADA